MAKKKTIDLRSVDPTPVPAGDVNIIYNGTRIGGFSEDTEATLKTAGCRVEHDIYVNYEKPETGIPVGNTLNFTNNTNNSITASTTLSTYGVYNTGIAADGITINANSTNTIYAFCSENSSNYRIGLVIASDSDQYTITTGSTNWEYESRERVYFWSVNDTSPINNRTFNIVIAPKE